MSLPILAELESAAQIIMAPPNLVSSEQRQSAEKVFIEYRKSKTPYNLCREILERSSIDFVLFETADLLKSAIIREWNALQESDIVSLRQYLLQYIMQRQVQPFIRDRLLQVIAIIVKRGSVDDIGRERIQILTEIEHLIITGDIQKKILGLNLILTLMQEYAITVKSADVGLPWEEHFKAKKLFEVTDLRKIFQFCLRLVNELIQVDPPYNNEVHSVLKLLLAILESILTWGYISPMLPKRVIGLFEAVYESDQAPALRLNTFWKEIIFDSQFLPIMFSTYWKVRGHDQLAHHARSCLVQLASLNGTILTQNDAKVRYLYAYMEGLLKLITSDIREGIESLGLSNIIRKLVIFFPSPTMTQLPEQMQKSFLENLTLLTCRFAEGASKEEASSGDDRYNIEAFDIILEAWTTIFQDIQAYPLEITKQCSVQIFNTYLQCHLSPPHGNRPPTNLENEEIDENEDNDRIKFKDQLQTIGIIGRHILNHSLIILARLLEDRTQQLNRHLHQMQTQAMSLSEATSLDNVFEDIHWTVLITGHVLCMESEGETPLIPAELMVFSIDRLNEGESNEEVTLKYLASIQQGDVDLNLERCDRVVRLTTAVLKLCAIEIRAAEAKMGQFMSPEVGCTLMWFLNQWSLSYLLPNESLYAELSRHFLSGFGKDTPGSEFVVRFLLSKIQSNICYFHSEPILLQDTVNLFVTLVEKRDRASYIIKSDGFWSLVELQCKLDAGSLPQTVTRGLFKGFILAGAALEHGSAQPDYFKRVLNAVQVRFKTLLCQENFSRIYQEEHVKIEMIDILVSHIGIISGAQVITVNNLFAFLSPVLSELSSLLNLYHNYQAIVQLILEVFCECAKRMLCYLTHDDSKKLYEYCLATVQIYASCNANRFTVELIAEENSYQDLLLVMELLTNLLTKDCVDLAPQEPNATEPCVTAADVCLYGINFIMPLMTLDLLKYPPLCTQYYKMITFVSEIYPQKVCQLPEILLRKLLGSIQLGLTEFSSDVLMSCLDFIHVIACHINKSKLENSTIYNLLMPFLKILLDLVLTHQINSDMNNTASASLFALIVCYSDQYQSYVQTLIASQADPVIAKRLAGAFTDLTANIELKIERIWKLSFRDNFDKFVVNVHGFLLIK